MLKIWRTGKSAFIWDEEFFDQVTIYRSSSESVVNFFQTTRRHIPEDGILCNHLHEHPKFLIKFSICKFKTAPYSVETFCCASGAGKLQDHGLQFISGDT
jgi:hypothetical protein